MYPISTHTTRILVDIPDPIFRDLGDSSAVRAYLQERVAPVVPEALRPQLRLAIKSGRLRSMPNAWMPSTRITTPGLIMVGDASNMRHPITGSGMTVALKDAVLLASLLNPADIPHLNDSDAVLRAMRRFHWKRKTYSASLNILAQALYLLFVSEDRNLAIMQRGFVRYVQEGEKRFAEPAWIMGGLTSNPLGLFYHFLSIAVYSIRLHLRQSATLLGWILALGQSVGVLVSALGIIWGPLVDELRR
jgi:squalene monooxygenase